MQFILSVPVYLIVHIYILLIQNCNKVGRKGFNEGRDFLRDLRALYKFYALNQSHLRKWIFYFLINGKKKFGPKDMKIHFRTLRKTIYFKFLSNIIDKISESYLKRVTFHTKMKIPLPGKMTFLHLPQKSFYPFPMGHLLTVKAARFFCNFTDISNSTRELTVCCLIDCPIQ